MYAYHNREEFYLYVCIFRIYFLRKRSFTSDIAIIILPNEKNKNKNLK